MGQGTRLFDRYQEDAEPTIQVLREEREKLVAEVSQLADRSETEQRRIASLYDRVSKIEDRLTALRKARS